MVSMLLTMARLGGGGLAALVAVALIGGLVLVAVAALLWRAVRSGPGLRGPARQERLAGIVAWVRANGGRYRMFDNGVAQEFAGTPFVHDRVSGANVRAWLRVRGRPVEVMEYQFSALRSVLDSRSGHEVCRAQIVILRGAAGMLPPAAHRQLTTDRELQTITLRLERGDLIGWRDGNLIPESVAWQVGVMTDYLDHWRSAQGSDL
jgi:hypothetical protein